MAEFREYTEFSKLAKSKGGPIKLMSTIKDHNYQQGVIAGRSQQIPNILISSVGCVVLFAALERIPRLVKFCNKKFNKHNVTAEEARLAEDAILNEMEAHDEEEY